MKPFSNNITHLVGDPDFLSGRRAPFVGSEPQHSNKIIQLILFPGE